MQLSRIVLPAVLVFGSAVPFLAPAAAQAHEPVRHESEHHRHHRYEVLYRYRACDSWRCYGRFDSRRDARCAAERLEHEGFCVRIER
jgi:hypothetical protein